MRDRADAGPSPPLRLGRVGARPTHALAEATPELTPRPRFVAMARWYRGSVLDRTRDCLDGRRPSPAPAPLQRLRPRPSTGQHRRWWSIRTRTPKKQYLEKRRVVTCPGQSARRRRLSTLVISHHALLTHRHVLEVRRLLRLAVPAPPGPRVTLGARRPFARRWRRRRRRRRRVGSGGRARVIALGLDLLLTR